MKQDNLREALQNKMIQPSEGSWKTLNSRLNAHEHKEKSRSWRVFKVASVLLIFISVGSYYLKSVEDRSATPSPAVPSLIDNSNNHEEVNDLIKTDIADAPENPTIKKKPVSDSKVSESVNTEVAFVEVLDINQEPTNNVTELIINDTLTVTETIEILAIPDSEAQTIDDEVEQLLNKTNIKLEAYGQVSSNNLSANALLNSVEEDLYKDLKQKLIEKITTKLKNPKEVITSREN